MMSDSTSYLKYSAEVESPASDEPVVFDELSRTMQHITRTMANRYRHAYAASGDKVEAQKVLDHMHELVLQRHVGPLGWVDHDYLSDNQGPILGMLANYKTGIIWNATCKVPNLVRGFKRAGFAGGWLDRT